MPGRTLLSILSSPSSQRQPPCTAHLAHRAELPLRRPPSRPPIWRRRRSRLRTAAARARVV
eukprot:4642808-Pleurochrysis_carterae.AAC.1